jgi:HEAT repeat protein
MNALEAIGRLHTPDEAGDRLLVDALGRSDPELAKAAVRALSGRPGGAATAGLRVALDHGRWDVRRLAAQALAERGALDAIRARAEVEGDPLVREVLDAALGSR